MLINNVSFLSYSVKRTLHVNSNIIYENARHIWETPMYLLRVLWRNVIIFIFVKFKVKKIRLKLSAPRAGVPKKANEINVSFSCRKKTGFTFITVVCQLKHHFLGNHSRMHGSAPSTLDCRYVTYWTFCIIPLV